MIFVGTRTGKKDKLMFEFDIMGNVYSECLYFSQRLSYDVYNDNEFYCIANMDLSKPELMNFQVPLPRGKGIVH